MEGRGRCRKNTMLILKRKNICIDQAIMFFKSKLKALEIKPILFNKHLFNILHIRSTELGTRNTKGNKLSYREAVKSAGER